MTQFSYRSLAPRAKLFLPLLWLGVVLFAFLIAVFTVDYFERLSRRAVETAIPARDMAWVETQFDGLKVTIAGRAPDERASFRVLESVGSAIGVERIVNAIEAPDKAPEASDISLEIVRNSEMASIIGILPSDPSPVPIYRALEGGLHGGVEVLNLVDDLDAETGDEWAEEVALIADLITALPNIKLSARPGLVKVEAIVADASEVETIKAELLAKAPENIALEINITAPRPLIAPFVFAVSRDEKGASLEACSATNQAELEEITKNLAELAEEARGSCQLGLGAPTENWGILVSQALADLSEIGKYELMISDRNLKVGFSDQEDPAQVERVAAALRGGLPPGFSYEQTELITTKSIDEISAEGVETSLVLEKDSEGAVQIRGIVGSETSRTSIESFAAAKFGTESLVYETEIVDGLPVDWETNSFGAINALSQMLSGEIRLTENHLAVTGALSSAELEGDILSKLAEETKGLEIVSEFEIIEVAPEPEPIDPVACVERLNGLLRQNPIEFEPSSTTITEESEAVVKQIAQILSECRAYQFEIGGHTDSQGGETLNQQISEGRARAVLNAVLQQALEYGVLSAKGYGESEPIADNGSEEGRARNRRIEIRLVESQGERQ